MRKDRNGAKNFSNRLVDEAVAGAEVGTGVGPVVDDLDYAADAGASLSTPTVSSSLRKNGVVLLKEHPCKIMEILTSKTGKHGHAKVHVIGLDIMTKKKYEEICPSSHTMQVPTVTRTPYTVVDMGKDGYISLMGDDGLLRYDIQVTCDDMKKQIREKLDKREQDDTDVNVTVIKAMGKEMVFSVTGK